MRFKARLLLAVFLFTMAPLVLQGQGTTGALTGDVTQGAQPLPGVTVTIKSPNLLGTRTTVSNENGAYNFPALPPGEYSITFTLEGMQTITRKGVVNLAQTARVDAAMRVSTVSEAITVTASAPAVMETTQVETNFKQKNINRLPIGRAPINQLLLAPGVTTGVNGPTIAGGFSYDNLYLVNGAVVNENLRGQPHALYIEDAIQETTVIHGAVSAEYGRFTGGVVSSITKSGGNEFSGSLRDSLDNPKWTSKSKPDQTKPLDVVNNTYEATFGGRIVRDRLWFFLAGRKQDDSQARPFTSISGADQGTFPQKNTRHRFEGKLTGNITDKHTIVASYLNNDVKQTDNCQFGCLDSRTLDPQTHNPNNFKTAHYSGILANNFLIEADYAKKYFAFVGFGGDQPPGAGSAAQLASGSPMLDLVVTGAVFNAPYFCGSCGPETRNNNEWELKGRYFLGTKSLGSHNMVGGYDHWAEQRASNNFQSPTNFRFDILNKPPIQQPDHTVQISVVGSKTTGDRFIWFPIAQASLGSDLKTDSFFINDKWDLNQHFSFNIGARYDKNNGADSAGHKVSNDSAVSPRLGVIYDVFGNGGLRLDANYNVYVGRLAETVAGRGSAAGNPAVYLFRYQGPDIPYGDSRAVMQQVFQWFLDNGGTDGVTPYFISIPGFNQKLAGPLKSPNTKEYTLGVGKQLARGYVRADYIHRNWDDFYVSLLNTQIGTVINPANNRPADLQLVSNSNVPDRKYDGLQLEGQYQVLAHFNLGGNYTWSKLKGNYDGETVGGGPGTFGGPLFYPEYNNFAQNTPDGFLTGDQRHRLRVWGSYDLSTRAGSFNFGLIQRYDSGTPYSAVGTIPISSFVKNPGYAAPPTTVTYFFSGRGALRWDSQINTDVAVNYDLPIHSVALYAKGEVRNAFNRLAHVGGDTTVYTAANAGKGLKAFDPFTATPVECPQGNTAAQCSAMGANWQKGPNFGKPLTATTFANQGSFQLPRTYLVSFGARF